MSEASLKRTITDELSAENIANYLIRFPEKVDYGLNATEANEYYKEGRQHLTYLKMPVIQKV